MTTGAIIVLVIGVWIFAGLIVRQLAENAGYIFGYYPGAGLLCRACVVLQFPAVIIRNLWMDAWAYARWGEPSSVGSTARMLWLIFKEPHLSPDDAFERMDEDDR